MVSYRFFMGSRPFWVMTREYLRRMARKSLNVAWSQNCRCFPYLLACHALNEHEALDILSSCAVKKSTVAVVTYRW